MKKIVRFVKTTVREIATEWRKLDPNGIADMSCQLPSKHVTSRKFINPWRF